MPYNVEDFITAIDNFAPFSLAEPWDNVGLLVGSPKTEVTSALVSLDLTLDALTEAENLGVNLIITHHPVIFPAIKQIDSESLLYKLIRGNISVISVHTNYDRAENGVNDELANLLELKNIRVLESRELQGIGRIGELGRLMKPSELAAFVKEKLNVPGVKFTNGTDISTLAIGGGSCAELWPYALENGAQALVSAEVKHHILLAAQNAHFTIIDASHYATEVIAIAPLARKLCSALQGAKIITSTTQSNPANYV